MCVLEVLTRVLFRDNVVTCKRVYKYKAYSAIKGPTKLRVEEDCHAERDDDGKNETVASLKAQVEDLQRRLEVSQDYMTTMYASRNAEISQDEINEIPSHGMNPRHVKELIEGVRELDFKPRLNTSSYVNVVFEPEEVEVASMGAAVNLADSSVYPASLGMHDSVVNMIAKLWHAPTPPVDETTGISGNYSGSGTLGSTEACLLAGLALKFRWRKWYSSKHKMTDVEMLGVRPNLVISSVYQAAWEKLFRYMDIEPRLAKPSINNFEADPKEMIALCDERTIGVVGILGNHYNGAYDRIWDIDAALTQLNRERGYQIGIHVDAASGGFVAPFHDGTPAWDFRLDNVLSISASGHKFGESVCGTGWVVFRQRKNLADHIAISVSYLGGKCDSITLNFSRPASGVYVQYYKLLRLGIAGYRHKVKNQMSVTAYIRWELLKLRRPDGKPRFNILDNGENLPVVSARLNNKDGSLKYNDIDLQHALAGSHWYVSGYGLSFENPKTGKKEALFYDERKGATMFRIVCKSNITRQMAANLVKQIKEVLPVLDKHVYSPMGWKLGAGEGAMKPRYTTC